jgi:hypothetical protein
MGAFMSIAKGSSEEPWLLELHYNSPSAGREERGESGEEGKPTVLVGKGTNNLAIVLQEKIKFSPTHSDLQKNLKIFIKLKHFRLQSIRTVSFYLHVTYIHVHVHVHVLIFFLFIPNSRCDL